MSGCVTGWRWWGLLPLGILSTADTRLQSRKQASRSLRRQLFLTTRVQIYTLKMRTSAGKRSRISLVREHKNSHICFYLQSSKSPQESHAHLRQFWRAKLRDRSQGPAGDSAGSDTKEKHQVLPHPNSKRKGETRSGGNNLE